MLLSAYAAAATLAAPVLRLSLRRRVARGKEVAARLAERRGIDATPRPEGKLLWVHAASVGETMSVLPVLAALPCHVRVLLTTGTVTSAALLARRLPDLGLAGRVVHRFVPLDVPGWTRRFLDHWSPDAAAFVESELWPNLLAGCRARRIPLMLVNARLSERSFRRWRCVPGFAGAMLAGATVRARTEADAARFRALGADARAVGDLKFAADPLPADAGELARLRTVVGDRPVWLAASTHPGEEAIVLEAHARVLRDWPGLLTIVAPRHPERGAAILPGAPRRSVGEDPAGPVWIADTLGELGLLYRLAPIVVVGRSLVPPGGGQNVLEPARMGCAAASGPFTGNFSEAVAALGDALARVHDAGSLAAWVSGMLADGSARVAMGERARAAASADADLPRRTADALMALL